MAYKLIWSPAARDDLHDIVVFIARDNPYRAMSFGYELISETDRLQEFPELGRIVPEFFEGVLAIVNNVGSTATASINEAALVVSPARLSFRRKSFV